MHNASHLCALYARVSYSHTHNNKCRCYSVSATLINGNLHTASGQRRCCLLCFASRVKWDGILLRINALCSHLTHDSAILSSGPGPSPGGALARIISRSATDLMRSKAKSQIGKIFKFLWHWKTSLVYFKYCVGFNSFIKGYF